MAQLALAEMPAINLQPGELYLARQPALLKTILGSCVGVTFFSARLGAGALCHGMLPRCPHSGRRGGATVEERSRYVDFSIRYLAEQFDAMGASRSELEVKVFGGADVLSAMEGRTGKPTIGALNCKVAREVLEQEGFRVAASDLGGSRGRTIHFHTGTGEVLVHRHAHLGFRKR
jgi:chemotaxis protein CheD